MSVTNAVSGRPHPLPHHAEGPTHWPRSAWPHPPILRSCQLHMASATLPLPAPYPLPCSPDPPRPPSRFLPPYPPNPPPLPQVSGLTAIGGMVLAGGGFIPQTPAQWLAATAMSASAVNIGGEEQ